MVASLVRDSDPGSGAYTGGLSLHSFSRVSLGDSFNHARYRSRLQACDNLLDRLPPKRIELLLRVLDWTDTLQRKTRAYSGIGAVRWQLQPTDGILDDS